MLPVFALILFPGGGRGHTVRARDPDWPTAGPQVRGSPGTRPLSSAGGDPCPGSETPAGSGQPNGSTITPRSSPGALRPPPRAQPGPPRAASPVATRRPLPALGTETRALRSQRGPRGLRMVPRAAWGQSRGAAGPGLSQSPPREDLQQTIGSSQAALQDPRQGPAQPARTRHLLLPLLCSLPPRDSRAVPGDARSLGVRSGTCFTSSLELCRPSGKTPLLCGLVAASRPGGGGGSVPASVSSPGSLASTPCPSPPPSLACRRPRGEGSGEALQGDLGPAELSKEKGSWGGARGCSPQGAGMFCWWS